MRRIKLTIAYDGTNYCGFQVQPELPTIEGELNRALGELTGEHIEVIGASRTDSGVHAYGNVAVFDTASSIPADRFPLAIAGFLPEDIRVVESEEVPAEWHPRKCDCIKTYEYSFDCGRVEDPKQRLYTSFSRRVPDIGLMREAAAYLIGEHDFTSFANPSSQILKEGGSAVRNIYSIEIASQLRNESESFGPANTNVIIRITGNGFLYNMVRIIAGVLIRVGRGYYEPEKVKELLDGKERTKEAITAPPQGLFLVEIQYESEGQSQAE